MHGPGFVVAKLKVPRTETLTRTKRILSTRLNQTVKLPYPTMEVVKGFVNVGQKPLIFIVQVI